MKQYKIGFSVKGLISFVAVMLPNIIWMVAPPANDILAGNSAENPFFDAVLNICRWLTVFALAFVINKNEKESKYSKFFIAAVVCLSVYYISWILYYCGSANPWLFVAGLAAAPSLYFIFVALWLKNYPAILPSAIFAVIHVTVTFLNYK